MNNYQEQYDRYRLLVEKALDDFLPLPGEDWPETGIPKHLTEAMRYSLLSGGKRIRPVLLLAAYASYQNDLDAALPFAAAVEMIHTYSLIHDDLPAMDNDDLRRGKPTNHKVFGEGMAVLAGDALLNHAFEIMSASNAKHALKAIHTLACFAGAGGMIAGQTADIMSEGKPADQSMLQYIHRHKTADLLTAPLVMGLILAEAPEESIKQAKIYGRNLGIAFQITDDLLDLQGDPEKTGKAGNRDKELGKLTWPGVVGIDQAKKDVIAAVQTAVEASKAFSGNASFFEILARSIPERVK
ncbi:MAG: polyprenyl synthetase family protein [Bacillota bacterium]|nr:polyprenyl synthetase family protein [Bacillota bacterium]